MRTVLVLQLWPARARARKAAVAEAVALLRDLGATPRPGGPMGNRSGVVWVEIPTAALEAASGRLPRLGYSVTASALLPSTEVASRDIRVRWRGRDHVLRVVHDADPEVLRARAPDRRTFLLECSDGAVREVTGYRGGGGLLTHRALPVLDARMLVNLVFRPGLGILLDPFAGAGGIVLEARDSGWQTLSADDDATLRFGLAGIATGHLVADARALPLLSHSIDAIATEPPYHLSATEAVLASIDEFFRVLRPGGRLAMLVAAAQRAAMGRRAADLGFVLELDAAIDRKGTAVAALVWRR